MFVCVNNSSLIKTNYSISFLVADDTEMKLLSGHSKEEFKKLLCDVPDLVNEFKTKDKASDALYIYLMRLRTGRTYEEIGVHFRIPVKTVQRRCDVVREILKKSIVPANVNFEMPRNELLEHKSKTSSILFDDTNPDSAHVILDGTYIYLEKSTNYRFQKVSYNAHKMRNYLKIMMGVLTDGKIAFVLGPFKAIENDAVITEKIFSATNAAPAIKSFTQNDVFIVDRGFRDCETTLINLGFIVKMPTCGENTKLSTKNANDSRLVTRVRYNVERVNGVMKSVWKIFSNTIDIHYIPKIMDDFEIAAAFINRRSNLVKDTERTIEMAKKMKEQQNKPNELSKIVGSTAFERLIRANSYEIFEVFTTLPKFDIDDLEMISFGPYQVQQARCYLSNHFYEGDNNFPIFRFLNEDVNNICGSLINSEMDPILLMANLKSRYVSGTVHRTFVLIDKKIKTYKAVIGYSCSCRAGNRTAGCCSHVMSIIYYVTYARNGVKEVSKHLKKVFEDNNYVQFTNDAIEDEFDNDN